MRCRSRGMVGLAGRRCFCRSPKVRIVPGSGELRIDGKRSEGTLDRFGIGKVSLLNIRWERCFDSIGGYYCRVL